eukprot:TRINITY_DN4210_c0_g1_i1.p1 TRINITY_DN4210_c0_g1~~TRINITY_DN4210_c0_g1_i1.p1  ORF type:complete len:455 (+),score=61.93 TRINITY_DN4210_c0_g1_i1:296-1660(+)
MALWGLQQIGEGSLQLAGCPASTHDDEATATATVVAGTADVVPILLVLLIGRKRLFNLTARRFDRDPTRARQDGAFLATLLDSASRIKRGDAFWVHHGRNDESYSLFDPRRNWVLGEVESVSSDTFKVRTRELRVQLKDSGQICKHSSTGKICKHSSTGNEAMSVFGSILSLSRSASAASYVAHELPLAGRQMTVQAMLSFAQQELRCIDWCNITEDLMKGAICGHDAPDISKLYNLSRPLRQGEVIDYFMSHSWHDPFEVKWAKLQEVVLEFQHWNRRSPTFWLDKVCIDQRRIADGLKALPVNVMACRQVLVLCGPTYPDRLWCTWEICVVFSFSSPDQALERLRFEVLDEGSNSDVLERLRAFNASAARCYDPNEQRRLFQVIDMIGAARFDEQIRSLAETLQIRRKGRRTTRSGSIWSRATSAATAAPKASLFGSTDSFESTPGSTIMSI